MESSSDRLRRSVVGREAELAAVAAFLEADTLGPSALVMAGEAGIGKTTIMRVAVERASSGGLRVLLACPSAGERRLPYAALADLIGGLPISAVVGLAPPQRSAVGVALGREDGAVDEHALARGVLELLRLWGADGDLLLVVDDVQWLDAPTASALAFAFRRLDGAPVRVLAAVRSGGEVPQPPALGLEDLEDTRRLTIGPMEVTELGALLRAHLGEPLARPRLKAVHQASGGNPMFALELAQSRPGDGAGGATLAAALAERVRALPRDAANAASFAAAALRPSTDLLLGAGVGRDDLRSALACGVLEAEGSRLRFSHPLLGSAAYEQLLPDERREIHARLAAASIDSVERGHHVSVADPRRRAPAGGRVEAGA